jgi:hypothetical protein
MLLAGKIRQGNTVVGEVSNSISGLLILPPLQVELAAEIDL